MTVYVDEPIHPFGRMLMCHMVSPDIDELHRMAGAIGVARKWFQDPLTMPKVSRPHYDVAKAMRAKAIELGAKAIDRYQMVIVSNVAMAAHVERAGHNRTIFADPFRPFRANPVRRTAAHPRLTELQDWWAAEQRAPAQAPPVQGSLL